MNELAIYFFVCALSRHIRLWNHNCAGIVSQYKDLFYQSPPKLAIAISDINSSTQRRCCHTSPNVTTNLSPAAERKRTSLCAFPHTNVRHMHVPNRKYTQGSMFIYHTKHTSTCRKAASASTVFLFDLEMLSMSDTRNAVKHTPSPLSQHQIFHCLGKNINLLLPLGLFQPILAPFQMAVTPISSPELERCNPRKLLGC